MNRIIWCAALAAGLLGGVAAQEKNVQFRRVFQVKRDRVGDFEAAVKDLNAIYKKANVDAPTLVVQSLTGPDEFVVIRSYAKLSQALADRRAAFRNNFEGEYIQANMRLAAAVEERSTVISMREAELSLPVPEKMPPFFRVIRAQVKPGKWEEYQAIHREMLRDGVKAAGIKTFGLFRTRMGGNSNEVSSAIGMESLTELDESPFAKAMGEAKFRAWLARWAALIDSSHTEVYRYRADLSTR